MTVKQTDRAQIAQFGRRGVEIFDEIEILLARLVDATATVHYRGANAVHFKNKCTDNAVDFASYCTTNMQMMSEVIQGATTFIATALGGQPISLEPPLISIAKPAIDADTSVEAAEDGPLLDLRATCESIFDQIGAGFGQNMTNMNALGDSGWIGPEYDAARDSIADLTLKVLDGIDASRTVMTSDITSQLQALGFAA